MSLFHQSFFQTSLIVTCWRGFLLALKGRMRIVSLGKMKKLMIAAAIVCAAAFGQAAQVMWGFENWENVGPDASYNEGDYGVLDVTKASVAQLWVMVGTEYKMLDTAAPDSAEWTYGPVATDLAKNVEGINAISGPTDTENLQSYKLVLLTDDGKYKAEVTGTATIESIIGMGETTYIQKMVYSSALTAGDWSAVPEPTSGLLMLLGVAGLALRRKRA